MAKEKREPKILRSIGFPLSIWQAADKMSDQEAGSINEHVLIAFKEYLIRKGYLQN